MKKMILYILPALVLLACGGKYPMPRTDDAKSAIYPLGIELNTLEGNIWTYHDVDPNGKSYAVQVKSIQSGYAQLMDRNSGSDLIGLHTFGFENLGYNSDGDLLGKTGNDSQVIIPAAGGSFSTTLTAGLFDGQVLAVTQSSETVVSVKIGTNEIILERGIGITDVKAPYGPGNTLGHYELESTMPDPPIHFGE